MFETTNQLHSVPCKQSNLQLVSAYLQRKIEVLN